MKDMAGRQRCVVPGCGRTFKTDGSLEVICGKHWRLADKRVRALRSTVHRRAKRLGWTDRLIFLDEKLWVKARDQAIERAMGL